MMNMRLVMAWLLSAAWLPAFAAPERVVSADGSLTEIVYALGEEARLVGVDSTSRFPASATELPNIGYMRDLSAEGSLSLAPMAIIATEQSGPPRVLKQIQAAGVKLERFSAVPTLDAVRAKIEGVAALLDKKTEGQALWQQVSAEVEAARQQVAGIEKPLRVLFIFSAAGNTPVVGGRNTGADTMINLAGAMNVAADIEGYKPMTAEAIIASRPDAILTMTRSADHGLSADELFKKPGLAHTPAAQQARLISMDGMYMLGFGPRIGSAIADLVQAFYPTQVVRQ